MSHWIYPANTKVYNVLDAFTSEKAVWPINSKIEICDTVYIYLSAPYKQIGFACIVKAINIDEEIVQEYTRPYFKNSPQPNPLGKNFMLLDDIRNFPIDGQSVLSYERLKLNGLNGMLMGPRKLENNPLLLKYIKDQEHDL